MSIPDTGMGMIPLDGWGRNGAAVSTNGAAVPSDFQVHSPTDPAQGDVVADPAVFEGKSEQICGCSKCYIFYKIMTSWQKILP